MPRKSTRNAQGGGSIRQRKDGTWEARYTLGRDPGTGKQVQKSVYGATQAEVRKKLQQICVDINDGVYTEPQKLLLGQWLDIWVSEYCVNVKKSTLVTYRRRVNTILRPALGAVKLSALTRPAIQAFVNALQRGTNREKPLSPKTIKCTHGVLHRALQQAVELDYIRVNPATGCRLPRIEKPGIKPMDGADINRFLAAIRGHENERAMIVALFTGMRKGELLGLTWDSVDFQTGTILLYHQLLYFDGKYEITSLKNDKTRRITPAPFVMDALREQKRVQAEWRLCAGKAWTDGNFVFTNELGEHRRSDTIYKQFKRVMSELGLSDMRFHDLRHPYVKHTTKKSEISEAQTKAKVANRRILFGNLGSILAPFLIIM